MTTPQEYLRRVTQAMIDMGMAGSIDQARFILDRISPSDDPHVIEVDEDGWALEHPLRCRMLGRLLDCDVHCQIENWNPTSGDFATPYNDLGGAGRYEVITGPDDGRGDEIYSVRVKDFVRLDPDPKPIVQVEVPDFPDDVTATSTVTKIDHSSEGDLTLRYEATIRLTGVPVAPGIVMNPGVLVEDESLSIEPPDEAPAVEPRREMFSRWSEEDLPTFPHMILTPDDDWRLDAPSDHPWVDRIRSRMANWQDPVNARPGRYVITWDGTPEGYFGITGPVG